MKTTTMNPTTTSTDPSSLSTHNMPSIRTHNQLAFAAPTTLSTWTPARPALSKTPRRSRVGFAKSTTMTLSPKDCSWKSARDLRAIESEFYVTVPTPGVVDSDMYRLRRRMSIIGRKEKQWAEFCQQFASLSVLTGIPMVDSQTGQPTATAWIFLSLSTALPLYIMSSVAQWIQSSSIPIS